MSLSPLEYLQHILDEINYLLAQSRTLRKEKFVQDETVKRAFVWSIEIVGEATKTISTVFKHRCPHVERRAMVGMRDRLIHDYFGVDYDLVWDVAANRVPTLKQQIENIMEEEDTDRSS